MAEIIKSDAGLEKLKYAIVRQAVIDYDAALKWLRKHNGVPHDSAMYLRRLRVKNECDAFFRSGWFGELCDLDGEELMATVRKKYYNTPIRWGKKGET